MDWWLLLQGYWELTASQFKQKGNLGAVGDRSSVVYWSAARSSGQQLSEMETEMETRRRWNVSLQRLPIFSESLFLPVGERRGFALFILS